ncbi:MAG: DUF997 family protein [Verrucomicrobiae bacterium]|nr:DUF997 family protein [Verrucomicrobiae bacterium]
MGNHPNSPPSSKQSPEELAASYRQSRKEMWVMLAAWAVFFLFVTAVCASLGGSRETDGSIPTLMGFPRWVCLGIAIPWVAANVFIYWFSFHFMKDTPLDDEE